MRRVFQGCFRNFNLHHPPLFAILIAKALMGLISIVIDWDITNLPVVVNIAGPHFSSYR